MRAESDNIIGDAMVEIGPDHEQYEVWAKYLDKRVEEKRVVRDADYWGFPAGTPFPLPDKPEAPKVLTLTVRDGEYQYGDMTGRIKYFDPYYYLGVEVDPDEEHSEDELTASAFDSFDHWDGNYAIRTISARTMGIDGVQSSGADVINRKVKSIVDDGRIDPDDYEYGYLDPERTPDWAKEQFDIYAASTYALMRASTKTDLDYQVFRGISVNTDHPLLSTKEGDTITFPISAFTPKNDEAWMFSVQDAGEEEESIIFVLQPGARVAQNPKMDIVQNGRGGWIERPIETLAQGKFEVLGTMIKPGGTTPFEPKDPALLVAIRQTHYYDIDSGEYVHV
jgi:hypothetical protein